MYCTNIKPFFYRTKIYFQQTEINAKQLTRYCYNFHKFASKMKEEQRDR